MSNAEQVGRPESAGKRPALNRTDREALLTDLLRRVSRSFYLTLRILPPKLRAPIGLAYLLARTADTIADTRILPPGERLRHLLSFRAQVQGPMNPDALQSICLTLTEHGPQPEERELLSSAHEAFTFLEALPDENRRRIRTVVITLTEGMEMDLRTFPSEVSGEIGALDAPEELDRYIFLVAGCVGSFWTAMLTAHAGALAHWDRGRMSESGIRFGKALQLTNVLRDVPKDLRIGRCYLPSRQLNSEGLDPVDLRAPSNSLKARPLLDVWLQTALDHYGAAEEYLLAISRRCPRLRLAALWPILIGLETLSLLAQKTDWLDPEKPVKVSRRWVYRMIARSIPAIFSNRLLSVWIARLRRDVQRALPAD